MLTIMQINKTEEKISKLVENMIKNSDNSIIHKSHIQKTIGESNPSLVKLACNNLVEQGILFRRGSSYSPNPHYKD